MYDDGRRRPRAEEHRAEGRPELRARQLRPGGRQRPWVLGAQRPARGDGPRRRRSRGALLRARAPSASSTSCPTAGRTWRAPSTTAERVRGRRSHAAGGVVPAADHRHRLRGRRGPAPGRRSAPGPCTFRTTRPSSGSPTTTTRATTRCGRCCRRPASPISQHLGNKASMWDVFRRDPTPQKGIFTSLPAMMLCENVAFWIMPGVLERFPGLKIVFVEPGIHWIVCYLRTLDRKAQRPPLHFPGLKELPSTYFKRQMCLTFVGATRPASTSVTTSASRTSCGRPTSRTRRRRGRTPASRRQRVR